MTKLDWNVTGRKTVDTGVDQGVVFVKEVGYPWVGLISVEEAPEGFETKPLYIDGFKYANIRTLDEFKATITAFTSPKAFSECEGIKELYSGFLVTNQPKKSFNLSYRTQILDDSPENTADYKLHLVYGAMTNQANVSNSTLGESVDTVQKSWSIETVPPYVPNRRPTSKLTLDSRLFSSTFMSKISSIIYGTEETNPRMPSISEILTIQQNNP